VGVTPLIDQSGITNFKCVIIVIFRMELEKQLCCREVLTEREIYQSEEATSILGTNMSIMVSDLVKAVKVGIWSTRCQSWYPT
jgi:hypothetical protein